MPDLGTPASPADDADSPGTAGAPEVPQSFRFEGAHGSSDGGAHEHAGHDHAAHAPQDAEIGIASDAARDIADVAAVEIISSAAVHLMSAAAVKIGLAEDEATGHYQDLDEARKLIASLAGLVTAASPEVGNEHARSLRDGLRTLQLAFAEALPFPDEPGRAPGEKWTGRVS
nr:DUF1844 domain-containing protein [Brachybacterium halotolerans]